MSIETKKLTFIDFLSKHFVIFFILAACFFVILLKTSYETSLFFTNKGYAESGKRQFLEYYYKQQGGNFDYLSKEIVWREDHNSNDSIYLGN